MNSFLPHINKSNRRLVYENIYQQVYQVDTEVDGLKKEYFVMDTGQRAGIVVEREDSVLLVSQYRLIINGLSWEIPGGRVDDGEVPEEAAIRECLEETGVRCFNPQPLMFYHPGLDTRHNPTYIFSSREIVSEHETHMIHHHEVKGCKWVPLDCCIDMISKGEIVDSFTIIGLLAFQAQKTRV